jgi:molecular chaperone HtpG
LSERVDEWLVANLSEYEGKALASVAKGELDLSELQSDDEKKEHTRQAGEHRALVARLKDALGDRVKEVRVTSRLTNSPSCLVADEHEMGGNLSRILKAVGQRVPQAKPILEINPAHPMVKRLNEEKARFADWSNLLFDQALLAEGGQLEDPAGFVRRMNELMLEMAGEGSRIIVPGR